MVLSLVVKSLLGMECRTPVKMKADPNTKLPNPRNLETPDTHARTHTHTVPMSDPESDPARYRNAHNQSHFACRSTETYFKHTLRHPSPQLYSSASSPSSFSPSSTSASSVSAPSLSASSFSASPFSPSSSSTSSPATAATPA